MYTIEGLLILFYENMAAYFININEPKKTKNIEIYIVRPLCNIEYVD